MDNNNNNNTTPKYYTCCFAALKKCNPVSWAECEMCSKHEPITPCDGCIHHCPGDEFESANLCGANLQSANLQDSKRQKND